METIKEKYEDKVSYLVEDLDKIVSVLNLKKDTFNDYTLNIINDAIVTIEKEIINCRTIISGLNALM